MNHVLHLIRSDRPHFLRSLPLLLLTGLLLSGSIAHGQIQPAGSGTSFTVVVPFLSHSLNGGPERLRLLFAGPSGTSVEIRNNESGTVYNGSLETNGGLEYIIDSTNVALQKEEGVSDRTLSVTADDTVSLAVMLDRGTASEAYGVIPHQNLGFEHVAITYPSFTEGTFVAVAAVEDSTTVSFTPTAETRNGNLPGQTFSVVLQKNQVYQLLSVEKPDQSPVDELTGTRVLSDKPVAVWSGSTCSFMPFGNFTCGPLIEQLPSIDMIGTDHWFARYEPEPRTYWRAAAVCDETTLRSEDVLIDIDTTLPDRTSHSYRVAYTNGRITSGKPVLLAHLGVNITQSPGDLRGAMGDPTMALVTPEDQMARHFRFYVPTPASRKDGDFTGGWLHSLSIVRPTFGAVLLDGQPVAFNGPFAFVEVESGPHEITADVPVAATVTGFSLSDGYSYVPAPVARPWELEADSIASLICSQGDTGSVWIRNLTDRDQVIDSIEYLNGLSGRLAGATLPITVPANDSVLLFIQFDSLLSGGAEGRIDLWAPNCKGRLGYVPVRLQVDLILLTPSIGSTIEFGPVDRSIPFVDRLVEIRNPTDHPVRVISAGFDNLQFSLAPPSPLPVSIPAGGATTVGIRYTPTQGDIHTEGRVWFFTENCPYDSAATLNLEGSVKALEIVGPAVSRHLCEPKEADTMRVVVHNRVDTTLLISQLDIVGENAGDFALAPGSGGPFDVSPKDSVVLAVVYTPGQTGLRNATLRLFGDSVVFDVATTDLHADNQRVEIDIDVASLDFGLALCDSLRPKQLRVSNDGTVRVDSLQVELLDGRYFQLSVPKSFPPVPGEETTFDVLPRPVQGRRVYDTIRIYEPLCGTEVLVPVQAACIVDGELEFAWNHSIAGIGESAHLNLSVHSRPADFAAGAPFSLFMKVRFRADLLLPESTAQVSGKPVTGSIVESILEGDQRIVTLRHSGDLPADGDFSTLLATVLLGGDFATSVSVDSIAFSFASDLHAGTVSSVPGSFTAVGWCPIDHPRLVRTGDNFGLKISPNPAGESATLHCSFAEDGPATISLYDQSGRRVATLLDREVQRGRYESYVNFEGIPSGMYRAVLETRTQDVAVPLLLH